MQKCSRGAFPPQAAQLRAKSNSGSWEGWLCHLPATLCPLASSDPTERLIQVCWPAEGSRRGQLSVRWGVFEGSGFHWLLGGAQLA